MKNKYILVSLIALVWLLFFDDNNLIYRYQAERKLDKLEQDHEYYSNRITEMQQKQKNLTDKSSLIRFAREEYLMKKPDEDIFIIIEE